MSTQPHSGATFVTDRTQPRNICTAVSAADHDAFNALAKRRGLSKRELARQLIEGAVRNPTAAFDLAGGAA